MKYQNWIEGKKLENLKRLIGARLDTLYSNKLSMQKDVVESQLFILKSSNGTGIILKNAAKETHQNNDYYNFLIEDIFDYNDYDSKSIVQSFSSVKLQSKSLKRIEIYNRDEIFADEHFDYDVVILFICKNDFRFIIALEERFDELMVYSSKKKIIEYYLKGLKLRMSYPSN